MSAVISPCGRYRYLLTRDIPESAGAMTCTFIMFNPSTADGTEDDPTIRKCVKFAGAMGAKTLQVVNLFAWRATKPAALMEAEDPVGPDNDHHTREALVQSDLVILAWGTFYRLGTRRQRRVAALLEESFRFDAAHALKLSKSGQPCHPLYLRGSTRSFPVQPYEFHDEILWEVAP